MRKVAAPLFILLVIALLLVGGRFATVRSAAASPAMPAAIGAPAPVTFASLDVPPPTVDVPTLPSAATIEPAKRNAITTPKPRGVYRCEIHPLQMGTVDTAVRSCESRDR